MGYLNPSAGAILLQLLLGGFGVFAIVRLAAHAIFQRKRSGETEPGQTRSAQG